jgi:hypothetical protein
VPIIARSVGLLSQCPGWSAKPSVKSSANADIWPQVLVPKFWSQGSGPKSGRVGDRLGHLVAVMLVMMRIALLLVALFCLWCGSCGRGFFRRFAVPGKPLHFRLRVPRAVPRPFPPAFSIVRSHSNASSSMLSESRSILAILTSCFALAAGKVRARRTVRILSTATNYRARFR